MDPENCPSIPGYYSYKNILITGATGFIGKVLIEKLLRSCPNIGKLYLLVRKKKSQDVNQRIEELSRCSVFDNVRADNSSFNSKLVGIQGDITLDGLGICQSDVQRLENDVHLVFNCAATVRFDEPLKTAMQINVLGVRRMIELCEKFRRLEAFIHVSTAFANCEKSYIEEIVYSPMIEPFKLIAAMEWMTDDVIDKLTPKIIGRKPNTYTFTKHLAEALLLKEGAKLPLAVVRPSIVGGAWKEPFPGWVDSFSASSGICIATGKGLLRSMKGNSQGICDLVPVDITVNMMIAVGWYTANYQPTTVPIFHSTIGNVNPYTWGDIVNSLVNSYTKNPLDSCFRHPDVIITNNRSLQNYNVMITHLVPAYLTDFSFRLIGKKPRMVRVYSKLHKMLETISFFTSNSWEWTYDNLTMLNNKLSAEDKKSFYFDPSNLHWPTYMESFCLGVKIYLLKEDMAALPTAKDHLRKLKHIRYLFKTVVLLVLWKIVAIRSNIHGKLWSTFLKILQTFLLFLRPMKNTCASHN